MIPVEIKKTNTSAKIPVYATAYSTCADVHALIVPTNDDPLAQGLTIHPGEVRMIRTGLSVRPAPGWAIKLHPRSGLALKHRVTLMNCTGIIDHDYPDELCVLLLNAGSEDFVVEPDMRIAQLEVHQLVQAAFVEVDALSIPAPIEGMADRVGGFGSTGLGLSADALYVGGKSVLMGIDGSLAIKQDDISAAAQIGDVVKAVLDPVNQVSAIMDDAAADRARADRSKNIGQAMNMFGEFLMECCIESATGITHFATEEAGTVLRALGQNLMAGHASCITHDAEMAHHTAAQVIESLQKV